MILVLQSDFELIKLRILRKTILGSNICLKDNGYIEVFQEASSFIKMAFPGLELAGKLTFLSI